MPYTSDSSQTSYISVQEFLDRMDVNIVANLCSDDSSTPIASTDLPTNTKLLAALNGASGMLESAIFAGERYNAADLQALNGMSREYMLWILRAIAAYLLWTRRDAGSPPETLMNEYNNALNVLNELSLGKMIFSFNETSKAGLPITQQMTASQYWNNNYVSSRWTRMFGPRSKDVRSRGF